MLSWFEPSIGFRWKHEEEEEEEEEEGISGMEMASLTSSQ